MLITGGSRGEFTENLAVGLRSHGVRAVSYHPGLLTIGVATEQLDEQHEPGSWDERVQRWYPREHEEGRTTATEDATRGAV